MATMTISRATANVDTRPMRLPAEDHPLYPLFAKHNLFRELAIEADRISEHLAPTPSTLADADPADALTGFDRDRYLAATAQRNAYKNAAYQLNLALMAVVDNLGGM
jgi:hypothetical protein